MVGGAEGDAFFHEIFGKDGCIGKAFIEALGDVVGVDFGIEHDGGGDREARVHLIVSEENEAFVFLHVAVVGEGLGFHHGGEEGEELAGKDASMSVLPRREFEHVGVAFLGHHGGAGGEGVGDFEEAEFGGDVEDPLLGPAREVHGDHGEIEGEFAEEIAVGDGIERIVG